MDDESETNDNINVNMFGDSGSVEKIKNDYGALRGILSKMEFGDLLQARLVCRNWKKESEFFIRRRIKSVDLTTDCRLKEYLKSDRTTYPSISLDVGGLTTKVLSKCDLKGVQELFVKTTGPNRDGRAIFTSDLWLGYLTKKLFKLFQQDNMDNLTSLDLQLRYPITCTKEESDFMRNFVNIRRLSFTQEQYWNCIYNLKNFEADGIGSILVSRCPSLQYLKLGPRYEDEAVSFNSRFAVTNITFQHLLNMLNERTKYGHAMPILQLHSIIRVSRANFRSFIQFVNLGLRLEILAVRTIGCRNKHELNEVIVATEKLLRNSADLLKEVYLDFFVDEDIIAAIEQPRITLPSLPQLQNLTIGAMMETNRAFQFIQLSAEFPCLKQLEFVSGWDTLSISGKVFPNLDKLLIRSFEFTKIPDFPPSFPNLRSIQLNIDSLREESLRFMFMNLTSVREMSIKLPYFHNLEVWDIFTGGAQQPRAHRKRLEYIGMDEAENNAPAHGQVVDAGNVEVRPLVASLENFTNLRELFIDRVDPRYIQAITYMTQFQKIQKLDKLRINACYRKFNDFQRCLDILQGYHCNVEIKHFLPGSNHPQN